MANALQRELRRMFTPAPARRADPHRKARELAKPLAKLHGIELEKIEGGWNVWPPKTFSQADPWDGDHMAQDWSEVLLMVRTYAGENYGPGQAGAQDLAADAGQGGAA